MSLALGSVITPGIREHSPVGSHLVKTTHGRKVVLVDVKALLPVLPPWAKLLPNTIYSANVILHIMNFQNVELSTAFYKFWF